jgi:hypothetical protein
MRSNVRPVIPGTAAFAVAMKAENNPGIMNPTIRMAEAA